LRIGANGKQIGRLLVSTEREGKVLVVRKAPAGGTQREASKPS